MDEATERKRTIVTMESKLPLMEREKKQTEIMAGPVGELTRLYAEQAKEHERTAAASERYQESLTKEAEHTLKLAQIKGNAQEIDKAQTALNEQKIQQAQALANSAAQAATDAENELSAMTLKLAADGEWTKADQEVENQMRATAAARRDTAAAAQENVTSLREETQATKDAADAANNRAAAGAAFTKILGGWADRLQALSPAARTAFDGFVQSTDVASMSVEELNGKMVENMDFMAQIGSGFGGSSGFTAWANKIALKALDIEQAFLAQKASVGAATEALDKFAKEGGNAAYAEQLIAQNGEDAVNQLGLLDDQDLSALRSSIEAANQKLRDMQQEAQDAQTALAEMNAEIMAESGNTAGADRLKLQIEQSTKLADLEQKRLEAEMAGNKEAEQTYKDMISKLNELYSLKSKNLEEDIKKGGAERKAADDSVANASRISVAYENAGEKIKGVAVSATTAFQSLNLIDLSGLSSQVINLGESVSKIRSAM